MTEALPEPFAGLAGRTVGPAAVGRLLDFTGCEAVFEAVDRRTDEVVDLHAIAAPASRHRHLLRRLRATQAALPAHPDLVGVHDAWTEGEHLVLALRDRAFDGPDLVARLDDGSLDRDGALEALALAARAIGAAHRASLADGELGPQDLRVAGGGAPRVVFEAWGADDDGVGGGVGGPVHFLSPERLGATPDSDPPSPADDVWTLGALTALALTGRLPFEGETQLEVVRRIVAADVVAPSSVAPGVSRALDAVVLGALERDPGRRFADGDAFADALVAALLAGPAPAAAPRPAGWLARLAALVGGR